MPYKLAGLIDLTPTRPSLLIPVFSDRQTNAPYVQECDEFMRIVELVPFTNTEFYSFISIEKELYCEVGQNGIVGLRDIDGHVSAVDMTHVFAYYDAKKAELDGFPLFKLQLARLCGSELKELYPIVSQVADLMFKNGKDRSQWLNSELHLHRQQKSIWDQLRKSNKRNKFDFSSDYLPKFLDIESRINWLSQTENFSHTKWQGLWKTTCNTLQNDIRIFLIGENWLYWKYSENNSYPDIETVTNELIDRSHSLGSTERYEITSRIIKTLVDDSPENAFYILSSTNHQAYVSDIISSNAGTEDSTMINQFTSLFNSP